MVDKFGDKYAFLQLVTAEKTGDANKVNKWKSVLSGIRTGDLKIGSRNAVLGMPSWATPDVVRGGFATGDYAAGGPLLPHEKKIADELGFSLSSIPLLRAQINSWYLSSDGVDRLKVLAKERRFIIGQPEEAALMTVAIMADEQHSLASKIVSEISPFFDRLRFYPKELDNPMSEGIHVQTVAEVRQALAKIQPRREIVVQSASLNIWIPLYDRLIDLIADTNRGDWKYDAKTWLRDFSSADKTLRSKRWSDSKSPFERCRYGLEQFVKKKPISSKDLKYMRLVVKRHRAKHGKGLARNSARKAQAKQEVSVLFDAVANVVIERTKDAEGQDGCHDPTRFLKPVSHNEATFGAPQDIDIPYKIQRKTFLALKGTVDELIDGGQIQSPEILAKVLPQITAKVHAVGFKEGDKAAIFSETYKAFHKRRSLLLLNLESQVRITEIPWVKALLKTRSDDPQELDLSRSALTEFASLTLTHFPQVQFPNPLVEQMQDLAIRAKIKTPFLPELAADIFMGRFSQKFEKAARHAVGYYQNKLYARYYNFPKAIPPGSFDGLCAERAERPSRQGWSPAQNGTIIEQALILTSHNMAALFADLDLSKLDCKASALHCFSWLCHRLELVPATYHAELISIKNAAYAWRQMIALLSELPQVELEATIKIINTHLANRTAGLQKRLAPIMHAFHMSAIEEQFLNEREQQFLGWTQGKHPLSQLSGRNF